MNLLIHDMAAAIERDAECTPSTDHDASATRRWSDRLAGAPEFEDQYLESLLRRLRMGPPSLRRR